jgi:cellulose synthase/poly-beta-1,6-N-acetylglucosamine synthase-like glycosyltransferase
MIPEVVFWLLIFLVFHSYMLYPFLLQQAASGKELPKIEPVKNLPEVYVVLSVYNGERVVSKNLSSVVASTYPKEKLFALTGSDASDDRTNEIISAMAVQHTQIKPFCFNERRGKIKVVNELLSKVPNDAVVIMTDVSASFHPLCFDILVQRLLQSDSTGLVGANIIKGEHRSDGISYQEKAYYERELTIKHQEGILWGASMGAFGACYAIRKKDMQPIPENFMVDDFFMTMQVMQKGKKAIYDMDALTYMDLPNTSGVEFKRKVRISTGNFQNLQLFWTMLFRFNGVAFAFWSHKAIRWIGPFILIALFGLSFFLQDRNIIYKLAFYSQLVLVCTPILNYFSEKLQIHLKMLKFAAHFYLMNLGILAGFIRFCKGVKNNVWQPTQR